MEGVVLGVGVPLEPTLGPGAPAFYLRMFLAGTSVDHAMNAIGGFWVTFLAAAASSHN